MDVLKKKLAMLVESLSAQEKEKLKEGLDSLVSTFPFNEHEYVLSFLLGSGKITLDEYNEIRAEYIKRNLYLYIFEISAPRGFGELWAQGHLKELVPEFVIPTKKIDSEYSGQYDFYLPIENGKGIKIEVKASRAVDFNSREPLYMKALALESKTAFDMNFQQVKPKCCDVFIWIGVWRDGIKYWVLSSAEVENSKYYSKGQHRGNVGEGQLHLNQENVGEFEKYTARSTELLDAVRKAYQR